jgi:hypothetical protein
MPPKIWYLCSKLSEVKIISSVTIIFTAVGTPKSRAVLPCFSFPVNSTQSVCTQTGHKHIHRMLLQTAVSFGQSAKGQHWRSAGVTGLVCAEGEQTQKGVSSVLCDVLSKHMFRVSTHTVYVRRFSCSCCLLQAHLPSVTATDRQTDTHTVCLSVPQRYCGLIYYFLPHLLQTQISVCDTKIYLPLLSNLKLCSPIRYITTLRTGDEFSRLWRFFFTTLKDR